MKRNIARFPERFCFQITEVEYKNLRFQNGTSSTNSTYGGRRYMPYVYTEQGIAMLSAVLKSEVAVDTSIKIMDSFVEMHKFLLTNQELCSRLDRLELSHLDLKKEIDKGRQAYVVYPLIEESEALDFKNLTEGYEYISASFPLPKYKVSIAHGKLKPAEKDAEMERFVRNETQIMVATTVIEVGVNVPNASVMVIESAERFGLSQLHQLRGRVGRGSEQSYCILLTGNKMSSDTRTRMETMVRTNDGFEIAEVDLKLRGPGDLMGTQQSGVLVPRCRTY